MPSGSFGPTTAGRMDSYVDLFQSLGGSMITLAKAIAASRSPTRAKVRRLLSWLYRLSGGDTGERKHQESRLLELLGFLSAGSA